MKEIIKQTIHNKAHVHIGKAGITEGVVNQIHSHFKKKKYIKIKFLGLGEFDRVKDAALYLAGLVKGKLVDVRGKTCVLERLESVP